MKIFIDFDDVLFNTKKFKKDLIQIFINNGVSEKQFIEESYWDGRYNLEKQIEAVKKKYKIDGKKLREELKYFFKNLSEYVFEDVLGFLKNANKHDLILISYGDEKIQTEKIERAKIANYFKEIVITHDKAKTINKILKKTKNNPKERIFFLDDRHKYIKEVKDGLPQITTVLVMRPEGRYSEESKDGADVIVNSLKNIF